MKMFNCLNCNKERKCKPSHWNLYCDRNCQHEFRWKTVTVPRIARGDSTSNATGVLKKYLVQTRGEVCELCNVGAVWNNKPLTLHLDHIDGNSEHNLPLNLRLLCPNCHSQTDNFGSKNKRTDGKRKLYYEQFKEKHSIEE